MGEALPWWSVVVANVCATRAMATYLNRAHPRLLEHMQEGPGS